MKSDSIKPWNLTLSKPRLETKAGEFLLTVGWKVQSPLGDLHHLFAYKFASPASATTTSALYNRLFAYLVLDQLPDRVLPEVLEQLGNLWMFYQLPHPESQPPQPKRLRAKMGRRYERPTYSMTEE